jgi:RNA polymerase sigma factor (sigma-70 family)
MEQWQAFLFFNGKIEVRYMHEESFRSDKYLPRTTPHSTPPTVESQNDPGPLGAHADLLLQGAQYRLLVERIYRGDQAAMEELYRIFATGIRFFLRHQIGFQESDDRVHNVFVIVVEAIQRRDLREPERLMGFVRTVVRRQIVGYVGEVVLSRKEEHIDRVVLSRNEDHDLDTRGTLRDCRRNPEQSLAFREEVDLMKGLLGELSEKDRDILTRFYLREQTQEQICAEMNLSDTQFRLLKSRAKARFGELGRRRIANKQLAAIGRDVLKAARAASAA